MLPVFLAQVVTADQIRIIADGGTRGLITALAIALIACVAAIVYLANRILNVHDAHTKEVKGITAEANTVLLGLTEKVTAALTSIAAAAEALRLATVAAAEMARLFEYAANAAQETTTRPPRGNDDLRPRR